MMTAMMTACQARNGVIQNMAAPASTPQKEPMSVALDRAVGVEAQGLAAEEGAGDARGEVAHEYDEQEEEEQQRTGRVVAR